MRSPVADSVAYHQPGDPAPKQPPPSSSASNTAKSDAGGMNSVMLYAIILLGGLVAFGAYQYVQSQSMERK